jgi:aspartyl-tRNA(Asn)/glutamyl-tRNA(Gln) amidotransferase subunit C
MIDDRDVEHVARLARLALTEAERTRMREQLAKILQYIDKLKELDVEGVEPTSHAVPLVDVMRDDTVVPSRSREEMMANAPDRVGALFRVPRIIED